MSYFKNDCGQLMQEQATVGLKKKILHFKTNCDSGLQCNQKRPVLTYSDFFYKLLLDNTILRQCLNEKKL
jgi:hypothetical protein